MNDASDCHEILDCPGIYVDAFRGACLSQKSKDRTNVFILSHYHGDHYGSLPREGNYQGPARIHCTPITAALLIRVHGVHENLVVAHPLGETWTVPSAAHSQRTTHPQTTTTRVTFYDANHCPGAAIILLQASNGKVHLHTGDMRYHERMQSYPLLRECALQRQIDTVLLDTTYAHPKHAFLPQEEAVHQIASQVVDLLHAGQPKTLVLLSCYSIGKEKVLWEVVRRTGQKIYATEKKRRMLECIQISSPPRSSLDEEEDTCLHIVSHCTDDPTASAVHIIPMGMAGQMWPFFQPDYKACLEYAQKQQANSTTTTPYERVVAFLPTGWADATNWNKKNSCKTVFLDGVTVSVRLVAYSEHSTFDELQRLVEFLQPRQVIPTVYSDDKDRVKIQGRFRSLIDSKRAKEAFFKSMTVSPSKSANLISTKSLEIKVAESPGQSPSMGESQFDATRVKSSSLAHVLDLPQDDSDPDQSNSKDDPRRPYKRSLSSDATSSRDSIDKLAKSDSMDHLLAMGFSTSIAKNALRASGYDLATAVEKCLSAQSTTQNPSGPKVASTESSPHLKNGQTVGSRKSGMQSITKFFSVKKG